MRRITAAVAVAAFGMVAAACAPPAAEEEQGPVGDTSVNIGWNQPFYAYNDDTSTGNATASTSRASACGASKRLFDVATVRVPPSGMASRALIARLSSAFSSWLASHRTSHRPFDGSILILTRSPIERRMSSSMVPIS